MHQYTCNPVQAIGTPIDGTHIGTAGISGENFGGPISGVPVPIWGGFSRKSLNLAICESDMRKFTGLYTCIFVPIFNNSGEL